MPPAPASAMRLAKILRSSYRHHSVPCASVSTWKQRLRYCAGMYSSIAVGCSSTCPSASTMRGMGAETAGIASSFAGRGEAPGEGTTREGRRARARLRGRVEPLAAFALVAALAVVGAVIVMAALLSGVVDRSGIPQVALFLALGAALGPAGASVLEVDLDSQSLRVVATLSL